LHTQAIKETVSGSRIYRDIQTVESLGKLGLHQVYSPETVVSLSYQT